MLKKMLALIGVLVSSFSLYPDIATIYSFDEVKEHLLLEKEEVLVVFDVDEVLITSEDLIFRPCAAAYQSKCWKSQDPKEEEMDYLASIMQTEIKYILVDQSAPSFLQSLQEKGFKTMALTACRTGKFGVIQNVEDWRSEQLLKLQIDFSSSWGNLSYMSFPEIMSSAENMPFVKLNHPPVFKNGILCVGDYHSTKKSTKGQLLGAFFDKINWQPKKVFFFDDKFINLLSMEDEMEKRGIDFEGFYFKGIEKLPSDVDEKIIEFQLCHLNEKKHWLNDKQARSLLKKVSK